MDYNTTSSSSLNNNSCAIFSSSSSSEKKKKSVKLSTDPQSVAARERRHRISDRFKILQSLVPGGSKMDTVSMLDEAIHYVKFLKTQIWLHQTMIDFAATAAAAEDDNLNHHRHLNENNNVFLHDYDPNYCYDDVLDNCTLPNYGVGPGNYTIPAQGGGVGLEAGESMSPPVDGGFSMY